MQHAKSTKMSISRTYPVEMGNDIILEQLLCRVRTAQVAARKESYMRMFLKGAAIALALAGTMLVAAGTANAAGITFTTNDRGRDHGSTGISISFGDVAYGYQDGYWDNGHRWHNWRNRHDRDNYRGQHGDNYRNGNHGRYSGQGWRGH